MARVGWVVSADENDRRGFSMQRVDGLCPVEDTDIPRKGKQPTIRRLPGDSRPNRSSTGNGGARF